MSDQEDYDRIGAAPAHASTHEAGGADEIDHSELVAHNHHARHEAGGPDVINVSGLVGISGRFDRGDPSTYDLLHGAMTLDGTWQDWDLSSIVPVGTTAVQLKWVLINTFVGKELIFRKKGNSNDRNAPGSKILVVDVTHIGGCIVSCDANRVIQYFATATTETWTNVSIVVSAYFK